MATHIVAADATVNNLGADFPGYRAEFPEFPRLPEAEALAASGFMDVTSETSLCAAFLAPDMGLRVCVEHPDPAERIGEEARYVVRRPHRGQARFDPWMSDSFGAILYKGDDWARVAGLIAGQRADGSVNSHEGRRHG
jgi:hypothetical protein